GSRSATGEVSRGGLSRGVGPPGAAALPPGAPGSPADSPGSVAGGGRLGSDAAPEASADGMADAEALGPAVALVPFVGPGVTAGTTAVVSFAQRYSRVVRPEA